MDEKHKLLGNFEKIIENFQRFLKKIAKVHYFGIFFKNLANPALIFARLDEKHNLLEIFRKFSKISQEIS